MTTASASAGWAAYSRATASAFASARAAMTSWGGLALSVCWIACSSTAETSTTGSIPATAELLRAIAALPRGALVLPGLDTSLSPEQHKLLLDSDTLHGHPQYGLATLLRRLGAGIADVEDLAPATERTRLVRAALAPAAQTEHWERERQALAIDAALAGVGVIAAPNADIEARAVALAARQAVAEGRSVGIVTRDQTLARRIAARRP